MAQDLRRFLGETRPRQLHSMREFVEGDRNYPALFRDDTLVVSDSLRRESVQRGEFRKVEPIRRLGPARSGNTLVRLNTLMNPFHTQTNPNRAQVT
jgi:hypothetical protein